MSTTAELEYLVQLINEVTENFGITIVPTDLSEAYMEVDEPVTNNTTETVQEVELYSYEFWELKEREAYQKIQDQENKVTDYYLQDNQNDREERQLRSNGYQSLYQKHCTKSRWNGDLPIDRFWFNCEEHYVDGTIESPLYISDDHNKRLEFFDNLDSLWYTKKSKSKYKAITVLLSRHIKERQYGRVFFSTETKYVPIEKQVPFVRKYHPIKGYIKEGNTKVYCKPGVYKNPLKGVLYKDKGKSILKELTEKGKLVDNFFWNLELYKNDRGFHPVRNEGSIARSSFLLLRNSFNYQIEDWFKFEAKSKLDRYDLSTREIIQERREDLSGRELERQIDILEEGHVTFSVRSDTIQRKWKRVYYKRYRKAIKIERAYREYIDRKVQSDEYNCVPLSFYGA